MTPQEFKSWFEGFTEGLSGTPTKAQWARIKVRVSEIDGKVVTERIYVDHYRHYFNSPGWWPLYSAGVANQAQQGIGQATSNCYNAQSSHSGFNNLAAMNALGQAEAASLIGG